MAERKSRKAPLASPVFTAAQPAQEVVSDTEEIVTDPTYERKKETKGFNVSLGLAGMGRHLSGSEERSYDELEGYLNRVSSHLREQIAMAVHTHSTSLMNSGWTIESHRFSTQGGIMRLIFDCIENDLAYGVRIKAYENKLKADREAAKNNLVKESSKKPRVSGLPERLTPSKRDALPWEKRMTYNNKVHEVTELQRIAKKFGLVLPKHFAEWKK